MGKFGLVLMLSIAHAAGAGGVATLVGKPPNIILAGQLKSLFPQMDGLGF